MYFNLVIKKERLCLSTNSWRSVYLSVVSNDDSNSSSGNAGIRSGGDLDLFNSHQQDAINSILDNNLGPGQAERMDTPDMDSFGGIGIFDSIDDVTSAASSDPGGTVCQPDAATEAAVNSIPRFWLLVSLVIDPNPRNQYCIQSMITANSFPNFRPGQQMETPDDDIRCSNCCLHEKSQVLSTNICWTVTDEIFTTLLIYHSKPQSIHSIFPCIRYLCNTQFLLTHQFSS